MSSNAQPMVEIRGIGKKYKIGGSRNNRGRLTESVWEAIRSPIEVLRRDRKSEIWALKDVSMDIPEGEIAGIIGRNGAGKTTLLKILSRITEPTEGVAHLNGRVGSLLEVGTGFHPDLTGRENIFLNGAILGMRREEIMRRFDEIVAFSEVGKFIDTPVKRYSSGMQVRLAFAVAAHLEPEIMIVDEVLAVGDAAFQRKCLGKMGEVAISGRTVLFVSHNMAAIENLCTTAYMLEQGKLLEQGEVRGVVAKYLDVVRTAVPVRLSDRVDREGDGKLRFQAFEADLRFGSPGTIEVEYSGLEPLMNVEVSIAVFTLRGEGAVWLGNKLTGEEFMEIPPRGKIVCTFERTPLLPGSYSVNVYCTVNGILADWITDAARLEVTEGDFYGTGQLPVTGYGAVAVAHRWAVRDVGDG